MLKLAFGLFGGCEAASDDYDGGDDDEMMS
jgi:hypothetical protein